MDFSIPEETRRLQLRMRQFVEEECLPVEQEMQHKDPDWVELPTDIFARLRQRTKGLGFWALDVPREHGGAGLDTVTCSLLTEEQCRTTVGSAHHTPFWPFTDRMFIAALPTLSEYQKEHFYYPLLRGERRSALAQTEPEAGSDAAAIKTRAVRDGEYWVINGMKRFSTLADRADFLYVTAVTDPDKGRQGISIFLVPRDTPGLRLERIIPVIRPQYSTELAFENCRVHDRQRLEMPGWELLQAGLGKGRALMAQSCVGRVGRCLDITIDYVQERVTFGQPLATRQAVQWMLVDSALDAHLTRLMALETAWKVDQGMDVRVEASLLKVFATEMAFRAIDCCIQCLGGIGLSKDLPLERWLREVRVMRIGEGPSEVHRYVGARALFRGWRP